MRCERGCVTVPGPRLGVQLDFFMKLYLPEGVKPSSSNRSTSDGLGLLCRQLGLLIRAGGRPHSPRRGFHLPDNRRYLDTSVPLREPGHICENTHFWRSWRPSGESLVIWSNQSCPNFLCAGCRCSAQPTGHRTPGAARRANQRRQRSRIGIPSRAANYQLSSAWSTSRNVSSAQPHESVTPEPPWP
jgi:hypothetical protein